MAFSACLNLLVWLGGAEGWLRAAWCHSACGPLLWWVHSASGHKELMAVGIMQWHARRLSPLLPSFLPSSPSKPAEAKLGIPARFDQMHLNAVAAPHMLWHLRGNKTGILFHSEGELPLTRASHLPCRGKVVVRIYNCRSGWYLHSVGLVKTSVFVVLKVNMKPRVITNSR